MWLQRFGTVDQNIFFGFCAVVFVIVVLVIAYFVIRICYFCCRHIPIPGYTLTSTLVLSTLLICVSVLFRGVQPSWKTGNTPFYTLSNVCQIFIPMIVLGYVMFGAALFIKLWMIVIAYRLAKNLTEFIANFILWVLVIIAGTVIIIWIASFTPNVFEMELTNVITNETIEDRYIFECRGWSEDGSRDLEQKAWQIATSVYMAVILLVAVAALPLHACENEVPIPKFALPDVVATIVICVNATCCVIAGLIVWFQYHPQSSADRDHYLSIGDWDQYWYWYHIEDSRKYAIIGSLQLWMIFVAVLATLISEVLTVRMVKLMSSSDMVEMRRKPNSKPQTKQKSRYSNGITEGNKKQKTAPNDENEEDKNADKDDGSRKKQQKKKRSKRGADKDDVPTVTSSSTRNSVVTAHSSNKDSITKDDDDDRHSTDKTRSSSADEGFYQDSRSETTTNVSSPDLRTHGDGLEYTAPTTLKRSSFSEPEYVVNPDATAPVAQTYSSRNSELLGSEVNAEGGMNLELDVKNRNSYVSYDAQHLHVDQPAAPSETAAHSGSAFTTGYKDEISTAM